MHLGNPLETFMLSLPQMGINGIAFKCIVYQIMSIARNRTEQNILPYLSKAVKLDRKVSIELLRSAVLKYSLRTAEVRSSMDTFHCAKKCP